ncbi:DNA methyltransferase [Thiopseudomonas alkaliphila]|nr:DNA methyltransferase [Thiopseudomonas alkaliphila]
MLPSFVTPLRYPGGKARLGAWLSEIIEYNNLSSYCYVEPYAGGAGAALYLLLNKKVDRIWINDADPVIYSFWWTVINNTDWLIEKIKNEAINIENWKKHQKIIRNVDDHPIKEIGFSAFFLNRTNRSGIIKGGVIGGLNQNGKYKIDARFNKLALIKRIKNIATYKDKIKISNLDALDVLRTINNTLCEYFVYFDPPYFNKSDQLYRNFYSKKDHESVAQKIFSLNTPWIVTYDNCQEILEIYKTKKTLELNFHYSTHLKRPIAKELLFYENIKVNKPPYMKR